MSPGSGAPEGPDGNGFPTTPGAPGVVGPVRGAGPPCAPGAVAPAPAVVPPALPSAPPPEPVAAVDPELPDAFCVYQAGGA
ncbi:hypothetical protein FNH09_37400 [Streptomyces adustus]|uniref:Uncharacterized protein n=1 Tax=Streptomyces adustus TaxID=1609272 RepID=A0A5N8VN52_9ACTN|nr:hypothetical protein [Streptomyces adustus]